MISTGILSVVLTFVCGLSEAAGMEHEVRPRIDEQAEATKPELYRISAEPFRYRIRLVQEVESLDLFIYEIRFPSARPSPYEVNNVVYGHYYLPRRANGQRVPGVIVLDILDGTQRVARAQALYLAMRGVAAMTLYLPYYGPRRPGNVRFLSLNLDHTRSAMGQAVSDVRRAAAILLSRPEIDSDRLAIVGTSFGGIVAALSAEMEPAFRRAVLMLAGGGFVDTFYSHPRAAPYRKLWEALGGSKERLQQLIAPLDPLTYAARLRDRDVIMLAGKRDEIVPVQAAQNLARAANAKLILFDCSHHGAILYFIPAMEICLGHVRKQDKAG